jgi:hypothetical protein
VKADARAALRDRARVVLWGVAILGVVQGAAQLLAQNHTGAVIAQVVVLEFGTGRLGVAWSDPLAPLPTGGDMARRAFRGAALGLAAAVVLTGASVMFRTASLERGSFGLSEIIVGLIVSVLLAARDELLLRGLVLRAVGASARLPVRLAVCGLAGAAYRFGTDPGASPAAIAFALLGSVALASLWLRDRGAWLAVGANAAFMFTTGPLAHGALVDVRTEASIDGSWVAVGCAAAFAISGVLLARRASPTPVRMPT